ncbi:MAG: hypothetical protein QE285_00210 [Aquabacterium sp.]|nr:hypothetical protein [Aquabacterium sp.]
MDKFQASSIAPPLALRASAGAGALQVAHAVGTLWHEIDLALCPIIGAGGVLALFRRSAYLAAVQHPWLRDDLGADGLAGFDLAAFTAVLAGQDAAQALACADTLLVTFHGLLASLIGASLTERLLHPVWGTPPISAPAQDTPP